MTTALALNSNWLDTNVANTSTHYANTFTGQDHLGTTLTISNNWWPYQYPWYVQPYEYHYHYSTVTVDRKIPLKLSEIEHLRKVAAKDAKLKDVLSKLTPLIEVVVDFD